MEEKEEGSRDAHRTTFGVLSLIKWVGAQHGFKYNYNIIIIIF